MNTCELPVLERKHSGWTSKLDLARVVRMQSRKSSSCIGSDEGLFSVKQRAQPACLPVLSIKRLYIDIVH